MNPIKEIILKITVKFTLDEPGHINLQIDDEYALYYDKDRYV